MLKKLCLLLCVFKEIVAEHGIPCGPNGKCFCYKSGEMDCSRTFVPVRKVCDAIGTLSQTNISALRIEQNGIETISKPDLVGCQFLTNLFIARNSLYDIANGSFANFEQLKLLDVSNNSLNIYDNNLEQIMLFPASLTTLKINGNFRDNTTENSSYPDLYYLNQLEILYIDGLKNRNFPENYRYMQKLEGMILSGLKGNCNLSVVSNRTFEHLIHLKLLNLSSCDIRNIYAGAFINLQLLEILDLSANMELGFRSMRNISYGLQFTNIQVLNISKLYTTFGIGTQLQKKDLCYFWNTSLREVSLNSNRLNFFETNAVALLPDTLEIAHLEDNKFTFTPYLLQFGCLSNLSEMYANRQNAAHKPLLFFEEPENLVPEYQSGYDDCPFMDTDFLRNISKSKGDGCPFFEPNERIDFNLYLPRCPKKLKIMHIADSVLQYNVSGIFISPPDNDIEFIDLSGNVLFSWHSAVGPFPKLKHLDLSKNYCSYVNHRATSALGSVENLQLQQNFLGLVLADESTGSRIFENLQNLKTLNLSSNIISSVPPSIFSKMTKLRTLDLSINNIDKWTIDVDNLGELMKLNLRFNSLRSLPEALRHKMEENAKKHGERFEIDFRNNTLTCSCEEKEFLEWMLKHRHSMTGFNEYIFRDSTGSRISVQEFVTQVNNLDKSCRSYVLLIVLCTIGISVFLSLVTGGFIYKNRWKLRYLIRMAKIRHLGYNHLTNDTQDETYTFDAFISYANENQQFVCETACPKLENQGLRLCLHERDFQPGKYVIDNILEAITSSKKTVLILSEAFLRSNWCMYEFNMARMDSIYSRGGSSSIVVVMYEEIAYAKLSTEMLAWIKSNTYLEYSTDEHGEELFWKSLQDAIAE